MALWMLLLAYWMRNGTATLKRFAWGVAGGSITGLQNFLKDALTITKSKSEPQEDHLASTPYVGLLTLFIILAVFAAFGGLVLLTACMKRYDVTYSAAMFVGSFVLSASIMSVIHYDTFAHLSSVSNYIMYPTGLVILIGGVYMLVQESKECNGEFEELVQIESPLRSPSSVASNASSRSQGQSLIAMHSVRENVLPYECLMLLFVRDACRSHLQTCCTVALIEFVGEFGHSSSGWFCTKR